VIFFTDENFAHALNDLLRVFDRQSEIRAFLDHFPKGTPDVEWIGQIGQWPERPFIVGGDGRILTNAVERRALRDSGCSFVYLASGWTETPWELLCVHTLQAWPKIVQWARRTDRQAVIEVGTRGQIHRRPLPG